MATWHTTDGRWRMARREVAVSEDCTENTGAAPEAPDDATVEDELRLLSYNVNCGNARNLCSEFSGKASVNSERVISHTIWASMDSEHENFADGNIDATLRRRVTVDRAHQRTSRVTFRHVMIFPTVNNLLTALIMYQSLRRNNLAKARCMICKDAWRNSRRQSINRATVHQTSAS